MAQTFKELVDIKTGEIFFVNQALLDISDPSRRRYEVEQATYLNLKEGQEPIKCIALYEKPSNPMPEILPGDYVLYEKGLQYIFENTDSSWTKNAKKIYRAGKLIWDRDNGAK